jgi:plastocyanin
MFAMRLSAALVFSCILLILCGQTILAQENQSIIPVVTIVTGASNPGIKLAYQPSPYNLPLDDYGTTVKWVNTDKGVFHTVTSFNNIFDSGVIAPGQSYNFTFASSGYYNYYCLFHPFMNGAIIIN